MGFIHLVRIIVPGVGQVFQDRHFPALMYFLLFIFFVNGVFMGRHVQSLMDPSTTRSACIGLAAVGWLISAYDYLHVEGERRRKAAAPPAEPPARG